MDKYCRICWNTKNWQQPTGEARKLEARDWSYVAQHGFGHEEWLFNFEWALQGYQPEDSESYRYAFIQPVNRFLSRYEGKMFSVLLHTLSPGGDWLFVARIDDLYVPDGDERYWALGEMRRRGWLQAMQRQVRALGADADVSALVAPDPSSIVNVRFRHQDVTFFDPRFLVPPDHKIMRMGRYHPMNWDDGFHPATAAPMPEESPETEDRLRSTHQRTRAAIQATTYDARHVDLQNDVHRWLCEHLGRQAVGYERDYVDLIYVVDGVTTYVEVKMDLTAKSCIRHAVGQLLEYAHYPDAIEADRLLVVGEAVSEEADQRYLEHLRQLYGLPLDYARWDRGKRSLVDSQGRAIL